MSYEIFVFYIFIIYNSNNDLDGFRFGIDDSGNYGYIKVGADTVTPFKTGDGSASELYDALKYSELVTEDMSFDQMCDVLSEYFSLKDINAFTKNWTKSSGYAIYSLSTSGASIQCNSNVGEQGVYMYYTSEEIDVSNYNYIILSGTAKMSQPISSSAAYKCAVNLYLDGKSQNVFISSVGSGSAQGINIKQDISKISKLKIELRIFQYAGYNTGTYISLNKANISLS